VVRELNREVCKEEIDKDVDFHKGEWMEDRFRASWETLIEDRIKEIENNWFWISYNDYWTSRSGDKTLK